MVKIGIGKALKVDGGVIVGAWSPEDARDRQSSPDVLLRSRDTFLSIV